jgi:uncharacterized protein (TIGR03067 family)
MTCAAGPVFPGSTVGDGHNKELFVRRFILPTLFAVLLIGLVRVPAQPGPDDAKAILGDWVIREFESNSGTKVQAPGDKKGIMRFTPNKVELVSEKDKTATWTLGKEKDLGTIDIIPEAEKEKEKTVKGIYELKDDTLRICFNGEDTSIRPKEFNSKPPQTIMTLKRDKKDVK